MKISSNSIVSNSNMIRNYKACRDKAQRLGKIFILKNNRLDAILFSVAEYERTASFVEMMDGVQEKDLADIMALLHGEGKRQSVSLEQAKRDGEKISQGK